MTRPACRRRGGALAATVGYVGLGGSAALLVMVGSRVLGDHAFGGLFVAWTIATTFGFGAGTPTEQLISRRLNVGAPDPIAGPLRRMAVVGVITAVVTVLLGARTPAGQAYGYLAPATLVAVFGWFAVTFVRGRIAGVGDLLVYGGVLITETVLRVLLLAAAVVLPGDEDLLLAAAIGLPVLGAAAVGAVFAVPAEPADPAVPAEPAGPIGEHAGFMTVSIGYQVCLQGAVLLLGWRLPAGQQALVGAFGAVNSYFRTPTVLVGGTLTHALVALSHAWGVGDVAAFTAALRRGLRQAVVVGLGGTLLAAGAAPFVIPIYYPHPLGLPLHLLIALATSTVLATMAGIMVQPLLASGRVRSAAVAWGGGGVSTVALFTISSGTDAAASAGALIGPLVALLVAARAVRRLIPEVRLRGAVTASELH